MRLSYNDINHLELGIFSNLTNLDWLDLGYNQLEVLHPDIFMGLVNLQKITLSGNRIIDMKFRLVLYEPLKKLWWKDDTMIVDKEIEMEFNGDDAEGPGFLTIFGVLVVGPGSFGFIVYIIVYTANS